jgi:protein TonB
MKDSQKTVLTYMAAFAGAVALHAGLAVSLVGFLNSAAHKVPAAETAVQKDAMVVTFTRPQPVKLQPEPAKAVARLREPEPAPIPAPEPPPQEPDVETPETISATKIDEVDVLDPTPPQQPAETATQSAFIPQLQRHQRQIVPTIQIEKPRPLQPIDTEAIYPLGPRLRGEEGTVRLLVRIGIDGSLEKLEISESSGVAVLDRAAERAVSRTRFAPATRNNQPVVDELTITIRFRLDF